MYENRELGRIKFWNAGSKDLGSFAAMTATTYSLT